MEVSRQICDALILFGSNQSLDYIGTDREMTGQRKKIVRRTDYIYNNILNLFAILYDLKRITVRH